MAGHYTAEPEEFLVGETSPSLVVNIKPNSYGDVFKLYLSTCTILGVNFTYSSAYLIQRCLWVMIVFAGLCATGYHSYYLLNRFMSWPIKTTLSQRTNTTFDFPAVTVCNHNAMYVDDAEYVEKSPSICVSEPAMERLIRYPAFMNSVFRDMIQQSAPANFADNTNQDPTGWLQAFITNATQNLYIGTDCNNLKNINSQVYNTYDLDNLTAADTAAAWSIFTNMTAFNQYWNATQETYLNEVPIAWYNFVNNTNYSTYKHISDLMIYYGAMTQMDWEANPVGNGTDYNLDEFFQNYNTDWWYYKK